MEAAEVAELAELAGGTPRKRANASGVAKAATEAAAAAPSTKVQAGAAEVRPSKKGELG